LSSNPTQQQQLKDAVKSLKCANEIETCRGKFCHIKKSSTKSRSRTLEAEYLETKAQQLEEFAESLENIIE
jgi:hypothetical protein